MARIKGEKSKIGTIIYNHIFNNKREYLIITILFFIGLMLSIMFFNSASDEDIIEIETYLNSFFNDIKQLENVDLFKTLKQSILYNITITLILWFGASTIIGIPIVYGTILLKGFSIGYTINSFLAIFGIWKGLLIAVVFLLLHNIIFIPTMFAISVSGVKLYKSIMKNKQRENIKLEILRHTIFCFFMVIAMIIASLIETYISTNLAIILLKNINF